MKAIELHFSYGISHGDLKITINLFVLLQLYYCEQRKKVVPLLMENVQIPSWLELMLHSNTYTVGVIVNYIYRTEAQKIKWIGSQDKLLWYGEKPIIHILPVL